MCQHVVLVQGIAFFHAGSDILRSKSLDRDSYNSGDFCRPFPQTLGSIDPHPPSKPTSTQSCKCELDVGVHKQITPGSLGNQLHVLSNAPMAAQAAPLVACFPAGAMNRMFSWLPKLPGLTCQDASVLYLPLQ